MTTIIAQTQAAVALEVRSAANDVKQSAEKLVNMVGKVEIVGKQLTSINPGDIKRITDSANMFAYQAHQVATELQDAAKALNAAANAIRRRRWGIF